jgi:protein TonB
MHLFKSLLIHLAFLITIGLMLHANPSLVGEQVSIPLENISAANDEAKKMSPHTTPHAEVSKVAGSTTVDSIAKSFGENSISATEMQKYLSEVANRINRIKQYPKEARIKEQEGAVEVLLEVSPEGKILNSVIATPSAFESLNHSALIAVQKLGLLPPLPLDSSGKPALQPIQLRIPIRFQLF